GVLSSRIAQRHGADGLPPDTLEIDFTGSAGQSFGGWLAPGVSCTLHGGANAVVEGVGDHGCEYMTGGRVVVLGATGRNFAAGMSGGLAFVLDEEGAFRRRVNPVMLDQIEPLDEGDAIEVRDLIDEHVRRTGSPVGRRVLDEWDALLPKFVKVFPTDYKRVLAELAESEALAAGEATAARNDHPHSTGGEGFVTTEGELDEPIFPEPSAEEVRSDG